MAILGDPGRTGRVAYLISGMPLMGLGLLLVYLLNGVGDSSDGASSSGSRSGGKRCGWIGIAYFALIQAWTLVTIWRLGEMIAAGSNQVSWRAAHKTWIHTVEPGLLLALIGVLVFTVTGKRLRRLNGRPAARMNVSFAVFCLLMLGHSALLWLVGISVSW